jgi:hypothetical protein
MAYNKVYKKLNNDIAVTKKVINFNVNNKNYIRYIPTNNNKICSIDTGDFLLIGKTPKNFDNGVSIISNKFRFKHILNDLLKIDSSLGFVTPNLNLVSKKIIKIVFSLLKYKKNNYMLLLNPVPGGFKAYYSGVFGFAPYSQIKKMYNNLLNKELFKNNKFFNQINLNKKKYFCLNKISKLYIFSRLLYFKELYSLFFLTKVSLTVSQTELKTNKVPINYKISYFYTKKIKKYLNLVFIYKI